MKNNVTYWIDLSDLSQWKGHYTGIQRVVFNIAKQYSQRNDVRYFVFKNATQGFFEVDFKVVDRLPEESSDAVSMPTGSHSSRSVGARVAGILPGRIRRRIPREVEMIARTAYHVAREIKNSHKKHDASPNVPLGEKARFGKDDVVLVMGSPWANPAFMPTLVNAKVETGFKIVQVIYDLIPIKMPQLFGEALFPIFARYLFDVATNSDGLVAISESSKRDVLDFCKDLRIPQKKVGVMRLGDEFIKLTGSKPKIDINAKEFILCVGTFEVRKNHQLLYQAYKEAHVRGIVLPKMVIVGRQGWLTEDLAYMLKNDPDVSGQFILLHNTNDENLSWLYKNCLFTVYPAVYEGWGLPIAESLAYGKACMASNTSSMVEIAPDLVEHFSPYDAVACLELMVKYSSDVIALQAREAKIAKEYGEHTWETTYRQFSEFVETIS